MEDKTAIDILISMMDKYSLDSEEKKAVQTAIGALGWATLGKGRMRNIIRARKAERGKDLRGNEKFLK